MRCRLLGFAAVDSGNGVFCHISRAQRQLAKRVRWVTALRVHFT